MGRRMVGFLLAASLGVSATGCDALSGFMREVTTGPVEVTDLGFAVAFPDDWSVGEATASDRSGTGTWLVPDTTTAPTPVIVAVPPTLHDRCTVVDLAPLTQAHDEWTDVDGVIDWATSRLAQDTRWVDIESAIVDLPAGRGGRITRSVAGEAEYVTTYVFADGTRWLSLECVSPEPSSARWRSIAESFEFLPAENG